MSNKFDARLTLCFAIFQWNWRNWHICSILCDSSSSRVSEFETCSERAYYYSAIGSTREFNSHATRNSCFKFICTPPPCSLPLSLCLLSHFFSAQFHLNVSMAGVNKCGHFATLWANVRHISLFKCINYYLLSISLHY